MESGQILHVREMYRKWMLQVKGSYRGQMQDGDHTDGHYITLFAEQLTRTFEVLVLNSVNYFFHFLSPPESHQIRRQHTCSWALHAVLLEVETKVSRNLRSVLFVTVTTQHKKGTDVIHNTYDIPHPSY